MVGISVEDDPGESLADFEHAVNYLQSAYVPCRVSSLHIMARNSQRTIAALNKRYCMLPMSLLSVPWSTAHGVKLCWKRVRGQTGSIDEQKTRHIVRACHAYG